MYIFLPVLYNCNGIYQVGHYGGSPSGKNDTSLLTTDFDFVGDELETFPIRHGRKEHIWMGQERAS